jgi:hypothetical protein
MAQSQLVHIKASVAFLGLTAQELIVQARKVVDSMPNNPLYSGATIDAPTLAGAIDGYIASVAEATDSKKAVAEREKQRMALIRLLRQLAHFVEVACKDDMAAFMTSGFQPVTYTRTVPQQLPPASITKVEQRNTGQFLVRVKPLPKARMYQIQYAPVGAGGAPPASWTQVAIPSATKPAVLNNLTPGVTYSIQVRAYGVLGYTEWSDAVTRMAI